MDESKKYEIAVLSEDYENKRLRFECLGMLNIYGKTPEQLVKQSIEYHIAEAEKIEAWQKLRSAMHSA
jgi:hypothetical protein